MSGKGGKSGRNGATIIIKREEIVEGGHHGGAWKVAYADFVTAMMAFFLLMWLLNATTEDQRRGLADYFAPNSSMSHQTSGSGMPFGGRTPFDTGSLVSDRGAMSISAGKATALVAPDDADSENSSQMVSPRMVDSDGEAASAQLSNVPRTDPKAAIGAQAKASKPSDDAASGAGSGGHQERDAARERRQDAAQEKARQQRVEQQAFEHAADQIRDAVRADPGLAALANQLTIDLTPEGLRIQLLDEEKQAMFPTGSSAPNERARQLIQKIAPVLAKLTEPISITGHTDAQAYRGADKSNWELSSERANVTRRLLTEAGLDEARVRSVSGVANRDLLLPADPLAAANRRIAIVVLRAARPGNAAQPSAGDGPGRAADASAAEASSAASPREPEPVPRRNDAPRLAEPSRLTEPPRAPQAPRQASSADLPKDAPKDGLRDVPRDAPRDVSTDARNDAGSRNAVSRDAIGDRSGPAPGDVSPPARSRAIPMIVQPGMPGRRSAT